MKETGKESVRHIGFINSADNKEILDLAHLLAKHLGESKEYTEYAAARKRLENNAENYKILAEYRRHQLSVHLAEISGEDSSSALRELENIYFSFANNKDVSDFLYAEGRFSRLINDVQIILGKTLDLSFDWEEQSNNQNVSLH
ncbi:MAG: YlbF family regulator [Clostridiales bacterium]